MDIVNIINSYPVYSIIVFSLCITLISTLITKFLTNQEKMKSMKERQKEIQKKLKGCKPGDKLFEELQSELLQITMIMMKSSFKPLLITFIPFLILFGWIRKTYGPILSGWFWYYLISSMISSTIYRKVFKMA